MKFVLNYVKSFSHTNDDANLDNFAERPALPKSIVDILEQIAGDFVLAMRSKPNTTGVDIESAISVCDEILFAIVDGLRNDVLDHFDSKLSPADLLLKFDIQSPFKKFNTRAKQNKFITSQQSFVEPVEYTLSTREENILSKVELIKKNVNS